MSSSPVPAVAEGMPKDPLASLPDVYGMTVMGDEMSPDHPNGSVVIFDKTQSFAAGDIVGIWFKSRADGEQPTMTLKRLVMGVMPGLTFPYRPHPASEVHPLIIGEQLNPKKQFGYRAENILAIHRCIGAPSENMRLVDRAEAL